MKIINLFQPSVSPPPVYKEFCETVEALANFPAAIDVNEKPHLKHMSAAMAITVKAHAGQVRKDGTPTVGHPKRVAQNLLLTGAGFDSALLCAGLLHDVLEDGPQPYDHRHEITTLCGKRVLALVESVTKASCEHQCSKCSLCEARFIFRILLGSLRDPAILHLKMADVTDNLQSISGLNPVAARRYVTIATVYINFARVRLGGSNRSYKLGAARLREAESHLKN